ncbi:GNVR domain-containing protein [Ekhidna sp.]|uniref:GNVR domain-containing protein n=1 Tax=Ekhidna sp. TaxID=2608089 RepID=UPI003C7B26AD
MSEERKPLQEDEIDLLELVRVVWFKRLFILKVTGIFVILGLVIALTSNVEYLTESKLLPESQEASKGNLSGLSGLAGLAGIDLSIGQSGSLTPVLYPEIVNSIPFQKDLIYYPVKFSKLDTTITSFEYFTEYARPSLLGLIKGYTIGLPGKIKSIFSKEALGSAKETKDGLIYLTKDEHNLIEDFRSRIEVELDPQTNILTVSVLMQDPVACAGLTKYIIEKLTKQVTDYKIEKVKDNLRFIEERYREAENDYRVKQKQIASFTAKNRSLSSPYMQAEYQRLQNELSIVFEVYRGLATQLEQARISVKERTPVFSILEPVQVPLDKNKPKRKLILMLSLVIGLFVSVTAVLIKNNFVDRKK